MVYCKNCKSINVKVSDLNFARIKPEGQHTVKHKHNKYSYFCWDCKHDWKSIPEVEQDYHRYLWLRDRTKMIARDMKDGSIQEKYINSNELLERKELARKITKEYKHLLNISPGDWYDIEEDSH